MAIDKFSSRNDETYDPGRKAVAVVPSDGTPLAELPQALYIGVGGDLYLRGPDDTAMQLWKNIPNGAMLYFSAEYVGFSTTCTNILAIYN